MLKLISLVLSLFLSISDSARILCVFQVPSKTHQAVFRVFTDELLQRGHELVVITTDPNYPKDATPSNLTEIDVHDLVYDIWNAEMEESKRTAVKTSSGIAHSYDVHKNLNELLLRLIETEQIQKIIKEDNKFDLLILEACFHSLIIFSHFIKAPVILLSSFGSIHNYVKMGVPTQELIYPSMLRRKTHDVAFWEELYDAYNYLRFENYLDDLDDIQSESFRNIFGPDIPSIKELYSNVDLLMLNQFPVWERTRPVPPNVVNLGGIHVVPGKDLPQDLKEYFNSSTNGVIYVSFGTSMDLAQVTEEKLRIIVDVLSELPYDVLWKWDKEELPGKGRNIKTAKWLPQADILRHPKLKLFITQGGLQSTDEAIAGGVPLIGIPFMHDQFFNCDNYVRHKIGLRLDINTLTEDEMKAAISLILTDNSYRENVLNLRTQMRDQPQSSLNRAISWTEYVLRHKGAKHLRSPAAQMHWSQYLELELVCVALMLYGLAVIILLVLLYFLCVGIGKCYRDYSRRRMINGMLFPR